MQLLNEQEQLVSFLKEDLSAHGIIPTPMPVYLDVLSADDVADLVAYLLSLTPEQTP